jgi:hypothetical protein
MNIQPPVPYPRLLWRAAVGFFLVSLSAQTTGVLSLAFGGAGLYWTGRSLTKSWREAVLGCDEMWRTGLVGFRKQLEDQKRKLDRAVTDHEVRERARWN